MQNSLALLDTEIILKYLGVESNYFSLNIFDSIESTNTFLTDFFKGNKVSNKSNLIHVAVAEEQTKGRGRNGRSWVSGFGEGLTFSINWYFKEYAPSQLSSLSLVVGIALIRVLKSLSIEHIYLKWPNDVLFNHHKLAGVLIELRSGMEKGCNAVIGIGINFNLSNTTRTNIAAETTDLFQMTGKLFDRNLVLSVLLIELRKVISDFEKFGFCFFKSEWLSYHAYEGKRVCLKTPKNQIMGIVDGVDDDGALFLLTDSGREIFNVGDVSLREEN